MSDTMIKIVRTYKQENTSVIKYRLVRFGTADNEVVAAASTSAFVVGVSDETANETTGASVGVIVGGIAKLVMAAASSKGGAVTGTTGGKGLITTTHAQYCVGWLLETTSAIDQIAKVLVNPFVYPKTA